MCLQVLRNKDSESKDQTEASDEEICDLVRENPPAQWNIDQSCRFIRVIKQKPLCIL